MIRTPDGQPTYTPDAKKAAKFAFRGFILKDPEYFETHDPHRIEAAMLCALQDQILWLTEYLAGNDGQAIKNEVKQLLKITEDLHLSILGSEKKVSEQTAANGVLTRALDLLKVRVDGFAEMIRQRDEKILTLQNENNALRGEISTIKDWIGNHTNQIHALNEFAELFEVVTETKRTRSGGVKSIRKYARPKTTKTTKRKR